MMIEVMKSKLHCVTVTEANLNYMGSITIDEDLMDAANLIAGEKVQVLDNNNGERFETYIIKARAISSEKRLEVIACYRDASLNNPLFNDSDKETTYVYVNDKQTYTPFSLDTDWEKAYDQATEKIKTIIK